MNESQANYVRTNVRSVYFLLGVRVMAKPGRQDPLGMSNIDHDRLYEEVRALRKIVPAVRDPTE